MGKLKLKILDGLYAVCQVGENFKNFDLENKDFFSITKTEDEVSVVILQDKIKAEIKAEKDWKILKIEGILDFSLIGILSKISSILAKNQISVFVISTFNTDYILIKEEKIKEAIYILTQEAYEVI
ncbi:MAG: ACT domain-containing protein [Fusobacteriaceae bacterium]|nr:ACT domain-containing protein [Fusobacteriaceae bacterium]